MKNRYFSLNEALNITHIDQKPTNHNSDSDTLSVINKKKRELEMLENILGKLINDL